MDNPNLRQDLFLAAVSGLAGFFILLLAWFIFIRVLVGNFFGGSLSLPGILIILGIVPMLITFGASIPAWALCDNLRRSIMSGVSAMATFVLFEVIGGQNYVPFGEYETMAFISAVLVTVLGATPARNHLQFGRLATLLVITVMLIVLRFVVPGRDLVVGPTIALLAWILLPMVASFFTMSAQDRESQENQ